MSSKASPKHDKIKCRVITSCSMELLQKYHDMISVKVNIWGGGNRDDLYMAIKLKFEMLFSKY